MARLPFVDSQSSGADAELIRAVQLRRGGTLLNLDRLLLHSAPFARGWNAYLGAIRSEGIFNAGLRELTILRVARLNRAPYEFIQHEPIARAAGVTPAKIAAIDAWTDSPLFDARERAVLAYTDAMTLHVQVAQPLFDALHDWFSAREIVEITATIAAYNMVSRFLEALCIEPETPAREAHPSGQGI